MSMLFRTAKICSIRTLSQVKPQIKVVPCHGLHTALRPARLPAGLASPHRGVLERPLFLCAARLNSTDSAAAGSAYIPPAPSAPPEGYIPDAPPLPAEELSALAEPVLNALGEPSLVSLGLGSWMPSGLIQLGLEQLHAGLGLPWWGAIVAGTICLRMLIFPLVILSQRNAANMANHMPTVQRLQERFTRARTGGNPLEAAKAYGELSSYMKRNNVNPLKNFVVPLAQLPIFLSVFVGIRGMANLPVESLSTGGLLWFTDLTVPDPLFLMPILTMSTFLVTLELGVDGVRAEQMTHTMKWVMRLMPIFMFPFILNFPSALLCYWFASNTFSLCQVLMLKIPGAKPFFKIPEITAHSAASPKTAAAPPKKGFAQGFKETWSNSKLMAQLEDRQRMDSVKFKEAGKVPIKKTYKYDPTKEK